MQKNMGLVYSPSILHKIFKMADRIQWIFQALKSFNSSHQKITVGNIGNYSDGAK